MSISKIQIYNIVLNILGISTPIENSNLTDNRIILLNNYYNLARDYVLKDFDWNFASTFRELSKNDSYNSLTKYKYAFSYPNNCICARDLFEKDDYVLREFQVTSLEDGKKVILTDVECPILRYTRDVDKEIYFSSEFSMALAYYLASLAANVLTGNIQKSELAASKYQKILKHARLLNAQEGAETVYDDTTYLDSRG